MSQPHYSDDADTLDAEIGRRAHMLLWDRGKTQSEFAASVGIGRVQLGRKLRGARPWYADEVRAVAAALGTSAAYLYGETDDPTPPRLPRLDSNQQPSD